MPALIGPDGRRFELRDGVIVGRAPSDGGARPDIDLSSLERGQTISRRHARIVRQGSQWYVRVEDKVTNTTRVAGKHLEPGEQAALNDGDAVELGAVPLVFLADWDAEATMVSNMQANAEIRVDGHSFPVVAIEGRRLRIGRRSPDGSYRPDIDLRDVPGSATVSHLHGHVYRRADEWMWHVVKTMNGTMIAGREVQPGEDVPLADGDPMRLGRVRATFHQRPVVRVVGNELLSLSMTPEELSLEAGTTHTGRISLVNVSGRVEQVMLELTGIPEEWFVLALPDGSAGKSLNLQLLNAVEPNQPLAGSAAQVAVTFAPPKVPESRAGIYPVSVSATTRGEEQVRRVATSKLHVLPFEGLELTVGPEEIKGTRGAYWAEVHNTGNAEVNVNLNVETRGKVKVDAPQQQVRLPNGGKQRIPLPMKVVRRHWLGFDQTYGVDITATAGGQRHTGSVRMVVASWLPRWAQFIVGKVYAMASPIALPVVTVALLLGVAYFLLRPPDVKDFRAEPASIVAGDAAQLVWTLDRAAGVTIEPPVGDKLSVPDGSLAVLPAARTEYTLTARNWLGISSSAKYTVDVLQIGAFKATPERLNKEGDEVTLQWETQGAQRVKIEPENDVKDPKPNGDAKVRPSASTTYVLTATGVGGVTTSAQVGVSIGAPNITRFDVVPTPRRPYQGDPIQLTWTVDGATRVDIGVDKGEVAPGKPTLDVTGGPPATAYPATDGEAVYTLTAANAAGSVQRTLSVPVARVGITSFDVDRTTVAADTPVTLRWRVEGANDRTKIELLPDVGTVEGTGEKRVTPRTSTTYTLKMTAADGRVEERTQQVDIIVVPKVEVFTAARPAIDFGDDVQLTWRVSNADQIEIRSSDGFFRRTFTQREGIVSDTPLAPTTYFLEARSPSGTDVKEFNVDVRKPGQPTPAPEPTPAAPAPAAPAPAPAAPAPSPAGPAPAAPNAPAVPKP